jgi:ribonuclease HI
MEDKRLKKVLLYTDGACSGNPGAGGYAYILLYKGIEKQGSGYEASTTNNRMELKAVIEGLKALKFRCEVEIYSDSAYVVDAFNKGWLDKWQKNDFKTAQKEEVKNIELWLELAELVSGHEASFIKVKGHSDNEYNNRCDKLAVEQITKAKTQS